MIMSEQGIKHAFISLICVCLGTLLGIDLKSETEITGEEPALHIESDMDKPAYFLPTEDERP